MRRIYKSRLLSRARDGANPQTSPLRSLVKVVFAVLTAALIPLAVFFYTSLGSDIRHIGGPPSAPGGGQARPSRDSARLRTVFTPTFKNHGFRTGHIERVELRPLDLDDFPDAVVQYVDKTPIRWRETRTIQVEVVVTVDFRRAGRRKFRMHYFDDEGREVYKETIVVDLWNEVDRMMATSIGCHISEIIVRADSYRSESYEKGGPAYLIPRIGDTGCDVLAKLGTPYKIGLVDEPRADSMLILWYQTGTTQARDWREHRIVIELDSTGTGMVVTGVAW